MYTNMPLTNHRAKLYTNMIFHMILNYVTFELVLRSNSCMQYKSKTFFAKATGIFRHFL